MVKDWARVLHDKIRNMFSKILRGLGKLMSLHLSVIYEWILQFLIKNSLQYFRATLWRHSNTKIGEPHNAFFKQSQRGLFHFKLHLIGYRLNAIIWMAIPVFKKIDCVIKCVQEPCCRSTNYKKTPQNETNCEMLHDVVYDTSEEVLEKNCSCDYVFLTNPQKVWYVD